MLLIPSNVVDGMGVLLTSTSRSPILSLGDGSIVDVDDGCEDALPPKYGMFQPEEGGINNSRIAPQ